MRKDSSIARKAPSKATPNKKKSSSKVKKKLCDLTKTLGELKPLSFFRPHPTRPTWIATSSTGKITVRAPMSEEEEDRILCVVTYAPASDPSNTAPFQNGIGDMGDPFTGMMLTTPALPPGTYVIHAHAEYSDGGSQESPPPDLTVTVP